MVECGFSIECGFTLKRVRDMTRTYSQTNSVLNKGESVMLPLFNSPQVLSSASDKTKLFAKNFLITLILLTQVSLYLFSLLELI